MDSQEMTVLVANMWDPVFDMIGGWISDVLTFVLVVFLAVVVIFLLGCRINPFKLSPDYLRSLRIKFLPYDLLRWVLCDMLTAKERSREFAPYGFTIFVGPQGGGKTTSLVRYLHQMHKRYPACKIVTNFKCNIPDCIQMTDWNDFLEIRNGTDGVIFAIDEIHSEYSSAAWQDFPEVLLSQISMQRKQRIKIVATSQMFSRVAKPIREQCFSVVVCKTFFGRLTQNKEYDASQFAVSGDSAYSIRKGVKPFWRCWFVQSDELRQSFDTYEVIERMRKLEFIPRDKRGTD